MVDRSGIESDESELRQTREENERLKAENRRLKALLESFALRSASSLETDPVQRKHKENSREQRTSKPSVPSALRATHCESSEPSSVQPEHSASSQSEKIALFRSLFRGREDVYAVRWESKKGRSGYSPACAHEWDPLLCRKPCAKCNNGRYLPVSDEVIRDHVLGKHTVGTYPLLADETCWFLAADFDKEGWQEDALAFLGVCRDLEVAAALERSRSGRGGHVWIFFEEAIPAALARKLGSALLTCAMDKRHLMGLDS